jgi:hypothetical protein
MSKNEKSHFGSLRTLGIKPIMKEYIIEWLLCQCKAIFGAIMNFLGFWPNAFIISKKFVLYFLSYLIPKVL